jgi:hypothetical protein
MPLLNFWKNSKEDVLKLRIDQVVSNAGEGLLRDHSPCSLELRQFLNIAPAESLFGYANQCLEKSFSDSGLALQDVVNELGRRLDFDVEDGLYRGKPSAIGFDGIWRAENEPDLIVEVKTTDYVAIDLKTHASYKEKLFAADKVAKHASTLIIVGREDTGALEAQIRGSRYAWEMRLISVEGLIRLVQIKEKSDDATTVKQIRQLLQPFEYTKIDRIIDVIFTTAVSVESQQEIEQDVPKIEFEGREPGKQIRTNLESLNAKRHQAVEAFAALKGKELVKRSATFFWSTDKKFRVCCAVSKRYESDYQPYWYAYHPKWDAFLAEGEEAYFIISCMDRDEAFAVPFSWLRSNKAHLNMTDSGDRSYWHVAITTLEDGGLAINTSKIGLKTLLSPFRFSIGRSEKNNKNSGPPALLARAALLSCD